MVDTAILITTFLRDDLLFRCIRSIRERYPDTAVFVGDNGDANDEKLAFCTEHNCTHFTLPYDVGVSGVRNESIRQIPKKYKYIFICEDDIIFTPHTSIEALRAVLDAEPKNVGMAGGLLKINDATEQHYEADAWIEHGEHHIKRVSRPEWLQTKYGNRYFLCDLILNVFLMRREVWEKSPWDAQFKTALEHSDFFLRLKYETDKDHNPIFDKNDEPIERKKQWLAAFVPEVWAYHNSTGESDKYTQYRTRPVGWTLFADKWHVNLVYSSFNRQNPTNIREMGLHGYGVRDENLELAIRVLEGHKCKWWLEAGTCLGAVREKDFISNDPDIDIGIDGQHIDLWDTLQEDFIAAGFELYKAWTSPQGKRVELSFTRKEIKLDLFFFFRKGDKLWHGAFGPDADERWGQYMVFMPHIFTASLFDDLKPIMFRGKQCYLPNPPSQYLVERYGPSWKKPDPSYKYWNDCPAVDRHFFRRQKTVFIAGVWDLFHVGHISILKQAKTIGTKLVVGVLTDSAAEKHKGKPVVQMKERHDLIKALDIADQVVFINDVDPTDDLRRLKITPHYVVHGGDWRECPGCRKTGAKLVLIPYTNGISTTEIRRRVMHSETTTVTEAVNNKQVKPSSGAIAIGIKTFMRDDLLIRTVKTIKDNFPYPYKLYIADDGPIGIKKDYMYQELQRAGHTVILLPHDSGLSRGRNAIVHAVSEDYVLIIDDDILITDPESILKIKRVLDSADDIGIASLQLYRENGAFLTSRNYQEGLRFVESNGLLKRVPAQGATSVVKDDKIGDIYFRFADQVVNAFLAKREVFDDVQWDNRIKIEWEHMDFFLQLRKTPWKACACFGTKAVHQNSISDFSYNQSRRSGPRGYFLQKWNYLNVTNQF